MVYAYLSPSWFLGYDVVFEVAFAVISLVIAFFAFKIHKLSGQRQARLLGLSFFFISLSYFIQSIFNYFIILNSNQLLLSNQLFLLDFFGVYAHMIFMTAGLVTLVYMTFKIERTRLILFFSLTSLFAIFLSRTVLYSFYVMSTLYLAFIAWHFIKNYIDNKQTKTLLIAGAFILLFFGSAHFILAVDHQTFYVLGHFFELFAYLLILLNLYLVIKGDPKA
ncbi:MAG: hypothetical protein GOV00_04270 [Candidatus Altiarchaeota archaeon]|nr:hypothetical protein [Candidatus Altiarchaeota archaeon]